jgi:hypothetical protein
VIHLALAPKSNAGYRAFAAARGRREARRLAAAAKHVRNAPTALMKAEGHGAGYVYDHDVEGGFLGPVVPARRNACRALLHADRPRFGGGASRKAHGVGGGAGEAVRRVTGSPALPTPRS